MRKDVQYLRALAIIAVLTFHSKQQIFHNGYIGVDIFFVISGYVLSPKLYNVYNQIKVKNNFSPVNNFITSRIRRLFPELLSSIFLTLPLIILALPTGRFLQKTINQAFFSILGFGNLTAAKNGGDYFDHYPNPYLHFWSLSAEWQIYFITLFACIILGIFSFLLKTNTLYLTFIPLMLVSSFLLFLGIDRNLPESYYNSISRIWEFLIGFFLYQFSLKFRLKAYKQLKFTAFLLLILLVMSPFYFAKNARYIEVIILSLTAIFLSLNDFTLPFSRILIWIGDRSYSLYLLHFPLFIISKHSDLFIFKFWDNRAIPTLIALILTFFLSDITFRIYNIFRNTRRQAFILLISTFLMFLLLLTSNVANTERFWGFNQLSEQPNFAGDVDKNCDRASALSEPCIYNSQGNNGLIVLVGDSHATAISEVLLKYSRINGFKLAVFSYKGCKYIEPLAITNSQKLVYAVTTNTCYQRDEFFRNYIQVTEPNIIVGAYRSQDCRVNIFLNSCGNDFAEMQINSFETLAEKFPESKVVLLSPVPEFTDLDFFKPRSIIEKPYAASSYSMRIYMMEQPFKDEIVLLSKAQRVHILRTVSIFCSNTSCFRKKNSKWLYKDTNHLSVPGSMLLLKEFTDFFNSK